jgi:hypothetical protein
LSAVDEDLIKEIRVMIERSFDVDSNIKSNDILELFDGYINIFV